MLKFGVIKKMEPVHINSTLKKTYSLLFQHKYNHQAQSLTRHNYFVAHSLDFSMSSLYGQGNIPSFLITGTDNNAEIWRYKKDGTRPWQRVLKLILRIRRMEFEL